MIHCTEISAYYDNNNIIIIIIIIIIICKKNTLVQFEFDFYFSIQRSVRQLRIQLRD